MRKYERTRAAIHPVRNIIGLRKTMPVCTFINYHA